MVEEEDEGKGDEYHAANDTPECEDVGDEGEIEVHAEDSGDHRERQQDCVEDGEQSHDVVGAVGLQGVEGAGEAFDQLSVVLNRVEHLLVLVEDIAPVVFHV